MKARLVAWPFYYQGKMKVAETVSWARDALERKALAGFLTKALVNLSIGNSGDDRSGVTIALDAEWGAGKTFFVKEWMKDLRSANHPVVYFDAWSNDLGEEASVALMAEILEGLEEWRRKLPRGKALATSAKNLSQSTVRSLRAALLPAAGVVAKGLIKKATGVAVDEIMSAITADGGEDDSSESSAGLSEKAL